MSKQGATADALVELRDAHDTLGCVGGTLRQWQQHAQLRSTQRDTLSAFTISPVLVSIAHTE
jgi:hypothetical protein